jgi:DNA-binding response OmpR family regulator
VTQHVLVVDDDPLECQLIQRTLHAAEIQAVTLTDSRQAIEVVRKQTFDAIFVDVSMPPPDGLEVTKEIRASESNQKTPVIMITGHQDHSMVARGFQAGINFFLYKPIVKDRLLNLVRVTHSVNRVEKRRFHRVSVRQTVNIRFNGEWLEGHTIDVSLNGLLVRVSRACPVASRVNVRLELPSGKEPLVLSGVVARVASSDSIGIHFDNPGLKESKQLQDFLLPLMLSANSSAPSK